MTELLGYGGVFTLLFVMVGPMNVAAPFAQLTHDMDAATSRRIARRAFLIALLSLGIGGVIGRFLLRSWSISIPAMLLTAGTLFFLVALRVVLAPYAAAEPAMRPLPPQPTAAALRVAFPLIVTPYGTAAVIVMLANTDNASRLAVLLALLVAVLFLDLLAMRFAHRMMNDAVQLVLRLLSATLAVVQLALAVQIILHALAGIGGMS